MPIISVFFGITIRMYYLEHRPPHFHAEFRGVTCTFDLSGLPLAGHVGSRRARRMIRTWALQHQVELEGNWRRLVAGEPIQPISPLE